MEQIEMFPPQPTADERLNTELAAMRLARMARDATRPNARSTRRQRAPVAPGRRAPKEQLELELIDEPPAQRPRTRDDCKEGPRPCPWVSCKFNLYLEVSARTGAIKMNFPDLEPWEMVESCALDVAGRGGETLQRVGELTNLTRERVRQVEVLSLAKLQGRREVEELLDIGNMAGAVKRRLPIVSGRPASARDE